MRRNSAVRVALRFKFADQWDSIVNKAWREIEAIEKSVAPQIAKIEAARNKALAKVLSGYIVEAFQEEANVRATVRNVEVWSQTADYETYKEFRASADIEVPSAVTAPDGGVDVVTEEEITEAVETYLYIRGNNFKIQQGRRTTKITVENAKVSL